jgi:hypothetical protein
MAGMTPSGHCIAASRRLFSCFMTLVSDQPHLDLVHQMQAAVRNSSTGGLEVYDIANNPHQ